MTIAVALRPHQPTSSFLFWFAVILLGVAALAYIASLVEHFQTPTLGYALVPRNYQIVGELDSANGTIGIRVGLELLNNTEVPLRYQATRFSVRIGGDVSPLSESPELTVPAGLSRGWFRDPLTIMNAALPADIEVDYRFEYGRVGKRMTRAVEGRTKARMPVIEIEGPRGTQKEWPAFVQESVQDLPLVSVNSAYVSRLLSKSLSKVSRKR